MPQKEPETYFLSIRDAAESQRLNEQHNNVKAMHGGRLLHPSVPQPNSDTRIADVATGTGTWLLDAIVSNGLAPSSAAGEAKHVGFDLSPAQFPAQKVSGVDFVVHDASQPFPEKYHGLFDLVHIRYLVLALREEQYAQILQNVTQLLRPGGYLHWQETGPHEDLVMEPPRHPVVEECIERLDAIRVERGMSLKPMLSLLQAFCNMPRLPARKGSLSGYQETQLDIVAISKTDPRMLPVDVRAETERLGPPAVISMIRNAATGKRLQAEAVVTSSADTLRKLIEEAAVYDDLGERMKTATETKEVRLANSVITLVARKASED